MLTEKFAVFNISISTHWDDKIDSNNNKTSVFRIYLVMTLPAVGRLTGIVRKTNTWEKVIVWGVNHRHYTVCLNDGPRGTSSTSQQKRLLRKLVGKPKPEKF